MSIYIVSLDLQGRELYNTIANLFRENETEKVNYVYKELINQAILATDNDAQDYYLKILNLPDYKYFANLDVLMNNPINKDIITSAFKSFAVYVMFQLRDKVGKGKTFGYILQDVSLDYIVVAILD